MIYVRKKINQKNNEIHLESTTNHGGLIDVVRGEIKNLSLVKIKEISVHIISNRLGKSLNKELNCSRWSVPRQNRSNLDERGKDGYWEVITSRRLP